MTALRVLVNALLMSLEIAAIAALAWLATQLPLVFAAATASMALVLGARLERARLLFEIPFYVEGVGRIGGFFAGLVGIGAALAKSVMVGFLALLTFSGTDVDRRFWIAIAMAVTMYAGVSVLRRLWLSLGVRAARWGYFRLALPLGIVFALGVALLANATLVKTPTFGELIRQMVLDTPTRPTVAQASELLFQLKLYIDGVIVRLLSTVVNEQAAQAIGVVVSVNTLAGLVAAVWAVPVAEVSLAIERISPTHRPR